MTGRGAVCAAGCAAEFSGCLPAICLYNATNVGGCGVVRGPNPLLWWLVWFRIMICVLTACVRWYVWEMNTKSVTCASKEVCACGGL